MKKQKKRSNPAMSMAVEFYRAHPIVTALHLLTLLLDSALGLLLPIHTADMVDALVVADSAAFFYHFFLFLVIMVLCILMGFCSDYLQLMGQNLFTNERRQIVLKDMMSMSLRRLRHHTVGHYIQLMRSDVDSIEEFPLMNIPSMVQSVLVLIYIFVYLFMTDWVVALVLFASLPITLLLNRIMLPRMEKAKSAVIKQEESMNNLVDEEYAGTESIYAASAEPFFERRADAFFQRLYTLKQRYNLLDTCHSNLMVSGTMNLTGALKYLVVGIRILQGFVTIGTVQLVNSYYSRMFESMAYVMHFFKYNRVVMISAGRLQELHQEAAPERPVGGDPLPAFETLTVENLAFAYDDKPVFHDVSLTVRQGEKVLITGGNGCGKSTLARVLACLEQPTGGTIRYNGLSYDELSAQQVRGQVILATAEPFIIEGTLEDNFFGNPVLGDEYLKALTERDIQKDGGNLSSGQKKRLQLMRCLSLQGEIYILDEPFNYVDAATRDSLWQYIQARFADKTLLVVSHDALPHDFFDQVLHLSAEGISKVD